MKDFLEDNQKQFVICGKHPILEALHREFSLDKILIDLGKAPEKFALLESEAKKMSIPVERVDKNKINDLAKHKNHQGIVALTYTAPYVYEDVGSALDSMETQRCTIVALDQVTDPHNLGAIARSAFFLGADLILLEKKNSPSLTETVHKVSAGASLFLPFCYVGSLRLALETLKERGHYLMGAWADEESVPLESAPIDFPMTLLLGSEGKGIRRQLKKLCDKAFYISGERSFDSLNVSVAAGVFLHEIKKSRG